MTKKKQSIKQKLGTEIQDLAKIITGELDLEKKDKEIQKLKKEAKENQKKKLRQSIKKGEATIEDDSSYTPENIVATGGVPKKVIQKIPLFEWEAPIRVQFPFEMKAFTTVLVVALLFILYLAVLGHYGLMFAIVALLFFLYVAGNTEPPKAKHSITTRGIESFDKLYEWYTLDSFWFSIKNNEYMLMVDTKLRAPARLIMLLDKSDLEAIFLLLQDKLLYQDIKREGWLQKATYGQYIPLDKI